VQVSATKVAMTATEVLLAATKVAAVATQAQVIGEIVPRGTGTEAQPGFRVSTLATRVPGILWHLPVEALFPRPAHLLNRGRVAVEPSMEGVPARNAPERT